MSLLLAGLLLPMWFTAPADSLGLDRAGHAVLSLSPVQSYQFLRSTGDGALTAVTGYADSTGRTVLRPHAPGTREIVWLSPGGSPSGATIYVSSRDSRGNQSAPSNGCQLGASSMATATGASGASGGTVAAWTALDVPIMEQTRERCGQAALSMVLRYYGAPPEAYREVEAAYDPVLRGSLITDLARAAERAGFDASIDTLTPERLVELLHMGVPPIVLYQSGGGLVTYPHFGVVTGWDGTHASFTLNDGSAKPYVTGRNDLVKRWELAGSQALVVRQRQP